MGIYPGKDLIEKTSENICEEIVARSIQIWPPIKISIGQTQLQAILMIDEVLSTLVCFQR